MKKRQFSKFLIWIAVLIGLAFSLILVYQTSTDHSTSALPHLTIGYATYPPFTDYDEDGSVIGIDADFANEVCRRIGYEAEFFPIDWAYKDELLNQHEVDCLWCGFSMDGLNETYLWAGPYMKSKHLPIVLADSPYKTATDLTGKSIAVLADSQTEYLLLNHQGLSQIPTTNKVYCFSDLLEVRSALLSGYCDAIYANSTVWTNLLAGEREEYRFLNDDSYVSNLGIAFAKDADPTLITKINQALEEILSDGTADRILQNYHLDVDSLTNEKGEP